MSDDQGRVDCGTCGKTIRFPVSRTGQVAKCPNCREPLRLGAVVAAVTALPVEQKPNTPQVATAGDGLEAMATVLLAEQLPFVRVQLGHLAGQLHAGETVYMLAKGAYKGKQALVAATNLRVIFIRTAMVLGKAVEDLPISKIGSIQSKTGLLGGEVQIFCSGNNVKLSMVMPKQRADDLASFISGQVNGLPLPDRPTYEVPVKKSAAIGCLAVGLGLVVLSGIASLFVSDDPPNDMGEVAVAAVASGETSPLAPPTRPNVSETPSETLRGFARECDELLVMIDQAWESGRFSGGNRAEHLSEWGSFIRSVNSRVASMREGSEGFSPAIAKIQVGSVAGYLQSLAMEIVSQDPDAFPKFRKYVGELIAERDAYLSMIGGSE